MLLQSFFCVCSFLTQVLATTSDNAWDELSRHEVGTCGLGYVGNLFMRCIAMYNEELPLALAKYAHPEVTQADKDRLSGHLLGMARCCLSPVDGFTWQFRSGRQCTMKLEHTST